MKINRAKQIAQEAFDNLVKAVEAGQSEKLVAYLKAMGQFHQYSLANAILIRFQKPEASHVAGFRSWQKLGRYVKKGEHGLAIMAPIIRRKRDLKIEDMEKKDGEVVMAFKTAYVFDISQTDGKPLPEFSRVRGNPADYTHKIKQIISSKGIKLEYSDRIGNALGMSLGGMIMIKPNLSPAEEFSVLCHELCHEINHKDKTQLKNRKVRETEAEAVAFVVSQAIGLDCNSAASDYIQLYNGEKKTLMESLTRIQQTAAEIIEVIMAKEQDPVETLEGTQPIVAAAA